MTETTTARPFDPELFNSATGAGLIYFFERMVQLNELPRGSADPLRTGCKKVLDAEEDPDGINLRDLDTATVFRHFENKNRGQLKPSSLDAYKKRFSQSVEMYLKYIDDDKDWNSVKPRAQRSEGKTKPKPKVETPPTVEEPAPETNGATPTPTPPAAPGVQMVTVPVPLRKDGTRATVTLPIDATEREVRKIAQIIELYAMTEQLAITTGE